MMSYCQGVISRTLRRPQLDACGQFSVIFRNDLTNPLDSQRRQALPQGDEKVVGGGSRPAVGQQHLGQVGVRDREHEPPVVRTRTADEGLGRSYLAILEPP